MLTRRSLIKSVPLLAFAPTVPDFLTRTARAADLRMDGRALVVVQLEGGNDAINTIVPFTDPEYARLRPNLKLDPKKLVKVNDSIGLNPALRIFDKLWQDGRLAVVPGIGYPNPNRSHFESTAIWHTARIGAEESRTSYGWLGRALDKNGGESCVVSDETPQAVRSRRAPVTCLTRADDLLLTDPAATKAVLGATPAEDLLGFVRRQAVDAMAGAEKVAAMTRTKSNAAYPATGIGQKLQLVAHMLKADSNASVYYTSQRGYDTHSQQQFSHNHLLSEFAGAVVSFLADLSAAKLGERVALLAFSEFGRTIKENGSGGTDHGTAGCVFLAGAAVKGGIIGTMPSLTDLEAGEPKSTTDFRRLYASILNDWLNIPSKDALGEIFESLPLFGK